MRSETISLMKMKIPGGNVGPGLAPAATRLPERTPGAASDAPTYRLATNRGPGPTVGTFSKEDLTDGDEDVQWKCRAGARPGRNAAPRTIPGAASDAPTYRLATHRGPGPTVGAFARGTRDRLLESHGMSCSWATAMSILSPDLAGEPFLPWPANRFRPIPPRAAACFAEPTGAGQGGTCGARAGGWTRPQWPPG